MKKLLFISLALLVVFNACDLTDLNENSKGATNVPPNPLFTNAQVEYGTFLHLTNVNVEIFKLMSQQWTTTTYVDEPRYNIATRGISDQIYIRLYRNTLQDLKTAEQKIRNNELLDASVKTNQLACINTMQVLTYSTLVNIFGDVPYMEALDSRQPAYTDDQAIYSDLLTRLDSTITQFDSSADGFGSADIYYNGNIEQWIKFANSLKLRLGITIADVDNAAAQTAIEEAAPNAIASNSDNAMIPFQTSAPNNNPSWEALVQSGRHDYLPAEPYFNRLKDLSDPRLQQFIDEYKGSYKAAPYGEINDYTKFSHFSDLIKTNDRPGSILTYDEVEFILAEAAARGYNVNGDAATHYNNAITADMEFWGVSDSDIQTYLSQPEVAYNSAEGDYRQKIAIQKWLGSFMDGLEGWTVYRRLDYPELELPPQAFSDAIPTRFRYPTDEANYNQSNYEEAASAIGGDEFTTKIFWDAN